MIVRRLYLFTCFLVSIVFFVCGSEERELELSPHDMNVVADRYEKWVVERNLELSDTSLVHYINSIVTILQKTSYSNREHRITILRSPEPNAYSLSNGSIHISVGLLSTIENEAQLAFLLAHEMAHVIQEHHIKRQYELHEKSRKVVQSQLASFIILGGGGGSTARMILRAMSGFSKQLEYEADSLATVWVAQSGYKAKESVLLFGKLKERFDQDSITFDTIYATHPLLQDRFKYSKRIALRMNIDTSDGFIRTGIYQNKIIQPLITCCELLKGAGKNDHVIKICNLLNDLGIDPVNNYLIKSQAFIAKGGDNDLDSAYSILTLILSSDADNAEAFRELGYVFLKQGVNDSATAYFNRYLEADTPIAESSFIKYYIRTMHE